jgi:hypothetical protein
MLMYKREGIALSSLLSRGIWSDPASLDYSEKLDASSRQLSIVLLAS